MSTPQETIAYDVPQYVTDFTGYFDQNNFLPEHTARGGFADIYSNTLGRQKYAVKVLRAWSRTGGEATMRRDFNFELTSWLKLGPHANILKFLGICYTTLLSREPQPCLLSFWQENGQISDYLKNRPDIDLLSIFEGVLCGLKHMHDSGVIHGDIRGANILVSKSGTPLIADFGLSKLVGRESSTSGGAGALRWMAPELFQEEPTMTATTWSSRRTKASDVWSIGMTFLELLSGKRPYSIFDNDGYVLLQYIIRGEKPGFPGALHESWACSENMILDLCDRCWAFSPTERPSVKILYDDIRNLQEFGSIQDSDDSDYDCSSLTPRARPQADDARSLESISSLSLSDPDHEQEVQDGPQLNHSPPASFSQSDESRKLESHAISYMTAFQNHLTASKRLRKHTVDSRSEGPSHAPTWYVTVSIDGVLVGKAFGPNKKLAQEAAARQAFATLENEVIAPEVPYLPIFLNRLNVRGSDWHAKFHWHSEPYVGRQGIHWVSTLYLKDTPIGQGKGNSERSAKGEAARAASLDSIL